MAHLPCEHCGSSDALSDYEDGAYCHSCHHKTFKKSFRAVNKLAAPNKIWVADAADMSLEAKAWLYGYRITDDLQKQYNIFYAYNLELWSNPQQRMLTWSNRICFPINDGKGLTARSLNDEPKYVSWVPKETIYKSSSVEKTNRILCLTEDILSCIRVGEILPTVSILGCNVSGKSSKLKELVSLADSFLIWLDGDRAGIEGAKKLSRQLQQFKPCATIRTNKDPKEYSNEEIKRILEVNHG